MRGREILAPGLHGQTMESRAVPDSPRQASWGGTTSDGHASQSPRPRLRPVPQAARAWQVIAVMAALRSALPGSSGATPQSYHRWLVLLPWHVRSQRPELLPAPSAGIIGSPVGKRQECRHEDRDTGPLSTPVPHWGGSGQGEEARSYECISSAYTQAAGRSIVPFLRREEASGSHGANPLG